MLESGEENEDGVRHTFHFDGLDGKPWFESGGYQT